MRIRSQSWIPWRSGRPILFSFRRIPNSPCAALEAEIAEKEQQAAALHAQAEESRTGQSGLAEQTNALSAQISEKKAAQAALRAERTKAEEAAANAVSASVPAPAPKPAAAKPAPAAPKPQPKKAARLKSVEPKPSRDEMTFAQRMVTSKEPMGENEIPGMAPAQKIIIVLALIAFVIFMGYTILTSMGLL